ncbi:zinc finger, CCHC-type, retrotransposon gag domain protein, partial [Tanacetum coccineum]
VKTAQRHVNAAEVNKLVLFVVSTAYMICIKLFVYRKDYGYLRKVLQTTNNLKEIVRNELEEFKKEGIMNGFRNEMATYRDFTACDVLNFDGVLDPIASTRWLSTVEGKVCEKGEEWIGACTWKEFKELFNVEFNPVEEIDRIRDEFQAPMQTSETVNKMWKIFNDLIRYRPEYHRNEKLKVERFQIMLRDDIREVISSFKCTILDDLLSLARVREVDLLRKKSKEAKETKRKLEFGDRDAKKPKQDHNRRSGGTQIKIPCKKCHKTHLGVCRANLLGCYKCGALNHMSTIIVNFILARMLYDSGASVSFVSLEFSKTLSAPPNKLPFPLEVEIADSKVVVVSNVYRDVEIEIDDSIFKINLIPIMLGVFDIMIGMDWLDKYNANILCSQKLVWVVNPQGREIIIYGDRRKGNFRY